MNIFVGNIAFSVTEQDLRELFAPYGVVDRITLITDRDTGRPREFGFVEMADESIGNSTRTQIMQVPQTDTPLESQAVPHVA